MMVSTLAIRLGTTAGSNGIIFVLISAFNYCPTTWTKRCKSGGERKVGGLCDTKSGEYRLERDWNGRQMGAMKSVRWPNHHLTARWGALNACLMSTSAQVGQVLHTCIL